MKLYNEKEKAKRRLRYVKNRERSLEYSKIYGKNHKEQRKLYDEKIKEDRKLRYIRDREKVRIQQRVSYLKHRKPLVRPRTGLDKNSEEYKNRAKRIAKNTHLKKTYRISLEEYNNLFIKQGGLCAICSNTEETTHKLGTKLALAVDHNHLTGKVRGLLCGKCNRALGGFSDNKDYLVKAIQYLENTI